MTQKKNQSKHGIKEFVRSSDMNSGGALTKKELRQLTRLTAYLRDNCGVSIKDSFRFAMVIIQNTDGILNILMDKEN